MALDLQKCDLDIRDLSGEKNETADYISRMRDNTEDTEVSEVSLPKPSIERDPSPRTGTTCSRPVCTHSGGISVQEFAKRGPSRCAERRGRNIVSHITPNSVCAGSAPRMLAELLPCSKVIAVTQESAECCYDCGTLSEGTPCAKMSKPM
eukprot:Blabericola_migrator_1__7266@NODE_3691_length_1572_cov_3_519601_g2289_i0_p1_GENE_NODE_3691_length_1572_cov_3_519601_g2289_i0NODE_3691_length_1572_cov_3_519601_g2289_i0_p1_ORF_typecomplete_len150_score14_41_NODE_3691_length_1572_cov_3_519601_g2289_i0522971